MSQVRVRASSCARSIAKYAMALYSYEALTAPDSERLFPVALPGVSGQGQKFRSGQRSLIGLLENFERIMPAFRNAVVFAREVLWIHVDGTQPVFRSAYLYRQ